MFAIDADDRGNGKATPARIALGLLPFAIDFLKRRAWLILLCTVLGTGIAAVLAITTHNRYSATTQLLIDPRDLRVLQNEVAPGQFTSEATVAYLESQARLIGSDSIRRRVIERLNLAGDPDFGGAGQGLLSRLGLGDGRPVRSERDPVLEALAAMDKQVFIRRNERTFVIDVTVLTGDGEKSARVANALVDAYLEDQTRSRSEAAQRASDSLGSRLSELRERVRVAEEKVETYRAANNLVGAGGKLVTEEQLTISNTQLSQARARVAEAQARFEQVRSLRPASIESGAIPEALQSQAIANLRAQLGAAITREADAQVLYGPQHPLYISAQAQTRDARRQVAEELARITQSSRAELERARAAEQALSLGVDRLKRDTLSNGAAAVQLRELEREADAHRQVFQAFLLRSREAREQTSVDTTNARVITVAVAPLEKLGPNRKIFVIVGFILGLLVGLALAVLLDIVRALRAGSSGPSMASVSAHPSATPKVVRAAAAPAAGPARRARWSTLGEDGPPATARAAFQKADSVLRVALPIPKPRRGWTSAEAEREGSAFHGTAFLTDAWDETGSPLAAAIRSVRDRLVIEEKPGANRKVAVIGLQPGAGTSLAALNLALAGAREGATALLIDLASGPSSLTASFAPDVAIGAEEVIAGRAGLIRAALKDEHTGAFFLPRPKSAERSPVPDPASITANLLDQTRRFEAVVIDAGAIGDGAMPHVISSLADDIVVVAPAGMGQDAVDRLIARAFSGVEDKVRVVIANAKA